MVPTLERPLVKDWSSYAAKALDGQLLTRSELLDLLNSDDDQLLEILQASFVVRRHYFGRRVKLNMIVNAKSGYCPEDCGYCSQSKISSAPIQKYTMLKKDVLVAGAQEAARRNAGTYCIVASGRGPTEAELEEVLQAVREIKSTMRMKICACLGILKGDQAKRLKEAGVERYNHNINTSAANFDNITTTHTYDDRVETLESAKEAGISPCSGGIIGMGESHDDIIDMAYALRELDADSIPINFLHAIDGTPLEGMPRLDPKYCLKVLALFRFVCPSKEIRVAGGRELNLRHLQPLVLYPTNSLFVGDYLTTEGQDAQIDYQMIEDLGFEIEKYAV